MDEERKKIENENMFESFSDLKKVRVKASKCEENNPENLCISTK